MKNLILSSLLFSFISGSGLVFAATSHNVDRNADKNENEKEQEASQPEEDNQYAVYIKGNPPNYAAALDFAMKQSDIEGLKEVLEKKFQEDPTDELADAIAKTEDAASDKKMEDLSPEELKAKIRELDKEIVGETRGISKPDPIKEAKGRLLRDVLDRKVEAGKKATAERAEAAVASFKKAVDGEKQALVAQFPSDAYKSGKIGKDGAITFAGATAGQTWVPTGKTVNGKPEYQTPDGKQSSIFSASQNTWLYKGEKDTGYRQRTEAELAAVQGSLKKNFSENQAPALAVASVAGKSVLAGVSAAGKLANAAFGGQEGPTSRTVAASTADSSSPAPAQKKEAEKPPVRPKINFSLGATDKLLGSSEGVCEGGACRLPNSSPEVTTGMSVTESQMGQLERAGVDVKGDSPVILSIPNCPWCDALAKSTGLPVVKAPAGFRGNGGSFPQVFNPKSGKLSNPGDAWRTYNKGVIPSSSDLRKILGR